MFIIQMSYYDVLNITKTATQEEIKKAYKQAATLWHPDKNNDPNAKNKFNEISQAYQILSDPIKKAQYDTNKGTNMQFKDPYDTFNEFMQLFMQIQGAFNIFENLLNNTKNESFITVHVIDLLGMPPVHSMPQHKQLQQNTLLHQNMLQQNIPQQQQDKPLPQIEHKPPKPKPKVRMLPESELDKLIIDSYKKNVVDSKL